MGYLIGTDEAGYGPNLGPLVISTTVWQVDDDQLDRDLYDRLGPTVSAVATDDASVVTIADSKILYRPGGDLAALERGVLSALSLTNGCPNDWQQLWADLCPSAADHMNGLPWYSGFGCDVPVDIDTVALAELTGRMRIQLDQTGIELVSVQSAVVFPAKFNQSVEQTGSKGTLLSATTLDLVADQLDQLPAEATRIVCDKHGGRNRYGGLLQARLAPGLVRVITEGRREKRLRNWIPAASHRDPFSCRRREFLAIGARVNDIKIPARNRHASVQPVLVTTS